MKKFLPVLIILAVVAVIRAATVFVAYDTTGIAGAVPTTDPSFNSVTASFMTNANGIQTSNLTASNLGSFPNGLSGKTQNPGGSTISVTASPFSWTNNLTTTVVVAVDAGTVASINVFGNQMFTSTGKTLIIGPGNYITVTYSVAPTIRYWLL